MAKLLLVEDDPDQLEIRTLILEQAGHCVFGASTSAQALALAHEHQPSLVVMDLRLPRTADGIALISGLRALTPAPRIVVLSGWTADLATAPDVDAVLAKPVRTPELIHLIARLSACLLCLLLPLAAAPIELKAPAPVGYPAGEDIAADRARQLGCCGIPAIGTALLLRPAMPPWRCE